MDGLTGPLVHSVSIIGANGGTTGWRPVAPSIEAEHPLKMRGSIVVAASSRVLGGQFLDREHVRFNGRVCRRPLVSGWCAGGQVCSHGALRESDPAPSDFDDRPPPDRVVLKRRVLVPSLMKEKRNKRKKFRPELRDCAIRTVYDLRALEDSSRAGLNRAVTMLLPLPSGKVASGLVSEQGARKS